MNTLMTIVYELATGRLVKTCYNNVVAQDVPYDNATEDSVQLPFDAVVASNPTEYYYLSSQLVHYGLGQLSLSSDIVDNDADGIEDMSADGTTLATYTITKLDSGGNPLTDTSDNETITVSATRGLLSTLNATLVNGTTTFTLRSIEETIAIDVTISHSWLGKATKKLQLTP